MPRYLCLILLLAMLPLLCQCDPDEGANGPWRHRLYTPTHFTKLDDTWIIVDCWHHRILYSEVPDPDLNNWFTITEHIGGPHSVATDGEVVVYEDTGHGNLRGARVKLMENFLTERRDYAEEYQIVLNVGIRPHRVRYDEHMQSFYALASQSQEIVRVTNDLGNLTAKHRQYLPFLNEAYTRSMTIIDGHMFFVTRAHGIIEATYRDDDYELVRRHPMPELLNDMNDVFRSEAGWYYATGAPRGIVRARSLEDISAGQFEDLYQVLGLDSVPYYLSQVDGRIYLTHVGENNGVITFRDAETGPIFDIDSIYDFGPAEPPDIWRRDQIPR